MSNTHAVKLLHKDFKAIKIGEIELIFDYGLLDTQKVAEQVIANEDKFNLIDGALRINTARNTVVMKGYELDKNKYVITPNALNHYMLDIAMDIEDLKKCIVELCFE